MTRILIPRSVALDESERFFFLAGIKKKEEGA
jgi:hypothetical protein